MLRIRCAFRLGKSHNRPSNSTATRRAKSFAKRELRCAAHVRGPTLVVLAFAGAANLAHAQGRISFSGAQTFMQTVLTFAMYAGAVVGAGTPKGRHERVQRRRRISMLFLCP